MKAYAQFTISKLHDGTDGTPAKLVNLTANATSFTYFVSKNEDGTIETTVSPENIILTAETQSCFFDVFTFSTDGITWSPVISGQHGFTLNANTLTISKDCDLFIENGQTTFKENKMITFKASTSIPGVIDTVTITRQYDTSQLAGNLGELESMYQTFSASINERLKSIELTVSEQVVIKGSDYEQELIQKASEKIDVGSITDEFTTQITTISKGMKEIQSKTDYIKRSAEGLEIFDSEGEASTLLSKTGLDVKVGGESSARFTKDNIDVKNAIHEKSLQVGKIKTAAISDGSLIDIWVGG